MTDLEVIARANHLLLTVMGVLLSILGILAGFIFRNFNGKIEAHETWIKQRSETFAAWGVQLSNIDATTREIKDVVNDLPCRTVPVRCEPKKPE